MLNRLELVTMIMHRNLRQHWRIGTHHGSHALGDLECATTALIGHCLRPLGPNAHNQSSIRSHWTPGGRGRSGTGDACWLQYRSGGSVCFVGVKEELKKAKHYNAEQSNQMASGYALHSHLWPSQRQRLRRRCLLYLCVIYHVSYNIAASMKGNYEEGYTQWRSPATLLLTKLHILGAHK